MCRVCQHNQIKDIDRALLAGATPVSLASIIVSAPRSSGATRSTCSGKWRWLNNAFRQTCIRGCFVS